MSPLLTIIYLDGTPQAAIEFKHDAPELVPSTNVAMAETLVKMVRGKMLNYQIINQVIRDQSNNPAIEKFFNHREHIPTGEPHHRIDENGLTSTPIQVGGEEMLEP